MKIIMDPRRKSTKIDRARHARDRHIAALAASLSSDHARAWLFMLLARTSVLALVAVLAGCGSKPFTPETPAPSNPFVIDGRDAEFAATCAAIYRAELDRDIDPSGADACLGLARRGYTADQLTEWVRSSAEYAAVLARSDAAAKAAEERRKREEEERERRGKFRGRLRAEGQRLVDAAGQPFVEPFASALTLLARSPAERAVVLDEIAALGFRGVRIFGGALTWAPMTPTEALQTLPAVLQETRDRNLYLLVSALTDTREGAYDIEAHVRMVAALTAGHDHALVEIANEPYHPSQSDAVNDLAGLCEMARRVMAGYPGVWALGAAPADRPIGGQYPTACGPVSTSHVERTSPEDMLARVVGLGQIQQITQRPVISSEPIGADEVTIPGRRLADPAWFGDFAHRQASLNISGVFHSEAGLQAQPLRPIQRAAAEAFVAGYRRAPIGIPVPPPFSCADAGDAAAIVRCNRAAYGRMSDVEIAAFLRAAARDLNTAGVHGGPFGVLVKPTGTNCNGYSCDIICARNGSDQDQWDVLGDIEGAQSPAWSKLDRSHIVVRPCEVVR